jgi:hypothetical protein
LKHISRPFFVESQTIVELEPEFRGGASIRRKKVRFGLKGRIKDET